MQLIENHRLVLTFKVALKQNYILEIIELYEHGVLTSL